MHNKSNTLTSGTPLQQAEKAIIMLHGRGATAENILGLADELNIKDFAILAPQATNNTWYPYSFMAKVDQNQPWLDSALELIDALVKEIADSGIPKEKIYFAGFSQGACLTLEYIARNAVRYGGAAAFTGGLIGEEIDQSNYSGDFKAMPLFVSTGDPDPHVSVSRVSESVMILKGMNAEVNLQIYEGRPHTIAQDEVDRANEMIFEDES